MPGTYIDNSVIGFDPKDNLRFQVDTYNRLSPILNMQNQPAFTGNEPSLLHDNHAAATPDQKLPDITIGDAISSPDPSVQDMGRKSMEEWMQKNVPEYKYGLDRTVETPYEQGSKFLDKKYGFSALRDNEDFYYKNVYMDSSWAGRNFIQNPARFMGRLIGGTIAKLGESLGYMGSMITSIGSNDYFEKIADNGFSKWFEKQEQWMKDDLIPVYKQAGFDDKGFFSKLGDWSFWNDSVSDAAAFMASAVTQTLLTDGLGNAIGLGKVGSLGINVGSKLGKFGRGLDGTIKFLTGADDVAGIANHAFNTASESFFESAGVFKETKQDLIDQRRRGENNYTDQEIDKIASQRASSDFKGNLLALTLSNAFENKYIFQPFKKFIKGSGELSVGNTKSILGEVTSDVETSLEAKAKGYTYSTKAGKFFDWKNPQGRLRFYGSRAVTSAFVEGLYEENIQLAMERMSRYGEYENKNTLQSIFSTLAKTSSQAKAAFAGRDQEAAESIGLGALIGVVGTGAMGKLFGGQRAFQGERRAEIAYAKTVTDAYNKTRREYLSVGDIYKKKEDGKYEVDNEGNLVFDEAKLKARADGLSAELKKTITAEDIQNPISRKLIQDDILANFIHASIIAGLDTSLLNRLKGLKNKSVGEIAALGFNPAEINTTPENLIKTVEDLTDIHKKSFASTVTRPAGVNSEEYRDNESLRRFYLYRARALALASKNAHEAIQASLTEQSVSNKLSPDNDSSVQEHNSLLFQLAGLQQFEKFANQNSNFYKEHTTTKKTDIQSRIKELKESLQDKVDSGELQERDGLLMSPSLMKNYVDNSLNLTAQQQLATSKNAEEQFNYISDKIGSLTNGYRNFEEYKKFIDSLSVMDEKADEMPESTQTQAQAATQTVTQTAPQAGGQPVQADAVQTNRNVPGPVAATPTNIVEEEEASTVPADNTEDKKTDAGIELASLDAAPDEKNRMHNLGIDSGDANPPIDMGFDYVPDEIDPNKPVSWQNPNITSKRDTENVSPTEERLATDNYSMMRADFIKKFVSPDKDFGTKYRFFMVRDTFPEIYSGVRMNGQAIVVHDGQGNNWKFVDPSIAGEVLILQSTDGSTMRVKDFFPNSYKDFADQPIVLSFDQNVFFGDLYPLRLSIKAAKLGVSSTDADMENNNLRAQADEARRQLKSGEKEKIEVKIAHSTSGIHPKTSTNEPVQKRLGDFTFEVAIPIAAGEKATQFGNKYLPGTVVAKIGKVDFPVVTMKLSEYPKIFSVVQATLEYNFDTLDQAQNIRNSFLNTLVNTNEKQFFTIEQEGDKYKINFRKAREEDLAKGLERGEIKANGLISNELIGDVNLNVSAKALKDGYTDFNPATGDAEFVTKEDYLALIKPSLVTNLKRVTDSEGNLYMETVNPYFSFTVANSVEEKKIQKNNYDALKQRIKVLGASQSMDLQKVIRGLNAELKAGNITPSQYEELRKLAESYSKALLNSAQEFIKVLDKQLKDNIITKLQYDLAIKIARENIDKQKQGLGNTEVTPPLPPTEKEEKKIEQDLSSKYGKKEKGSISDAIIGDMDNTPQYVIQDKYKYLPESNKFIHINSGRRIAESQLPKILDQMADQFPYKETAAGNQGFSKFTEDNVTIYRPPTKIASPEVIVIGGKISSLEEARKAVEGKTKLEDFLNKYCS